MDTWRMSVLEEQKKKELEKMLTEREQLKVKHFALIDDILKFTNGSRTFHVLYHFFFISSPYRICN